MVDPRFLKTSGVEAFTGNELLLKGALEAGVGLITGYPGSPVSDIFEAIGMIAPYMAKRGLVAQIANNEGLATARLNGARQAGLRALAVMKSVGMHVGADALAVGNLMEFRNPASGAVVVVGDDPWNETTQINSDSRYLSKHLHMPVMEPSTFQEIKDWLKIAFELSGHADLTVTYLVTTNQADGGCTVEVHPHPDVPINKVSPATLSSEQIQISDMVLIPPHTSMREATLEERHGRLLEKAKDFGINKWFGPRRARMPVGFIASGLSYCYLEEVLKMIGLWDRTPVLKFGVSYPLHPGDILEISKHVEHLVIVEEKRGFLEEQVAEILTELRQEGTLARPPALWGKKFPDGEAGFPSNRGLNVSIMLEVLGPAFLKWKQYFPTLRVDLIEKELAEILHTKSSSYDVPVRTPTFCPGCPHRDSAVTSNQMRKENPDIIFHGESGCHSMLQFAPNEGLMQNYSGMGLGGGTGAGMSPFVTNKQVVFLGDSTFFHSGMVAVSDSLKNNQNITYVILENDTTAMTGHQPTPANSEDIMGNPTYAQDIERLLRGMFHDRVSINRVDPSARDSYQILLEETVMKPGVKVIIADKECAITKHRRLNAEKKAVIHEKGFLPLEEKINITPEVCEYCLECTRQTGCPGLTVEDTHLGRKIATDLSTCVDDGACARTKACPSFEKVVIQRSQTPSQKERLPYDLTNLPEPRVETFEGRWSAYTAAIGGMGAGVVNAVLVRAGMKAGYNVSFLDKKGLAIRNGGVYGHVVFSKEGPVSSPVIPYGKADLLIGLDLLEAARGLDARINLRVAHAGRTRAVVNTHKNQTVLSLMGRQDFNPEKLEEVIQTKARLGGYMGSDFSAFSERCIGSKLYSNMMILGAAYQKGWVPVTEEQILGAIEESVRKADVASNNEAFRLGRYMALHPDLLHPGDNKERVDDVVSEKVSYLKKRSFLFGSVHAASYKQIIDDVCRWMDLPMADKCLMAHLVYDLIRYQNVAYAEKFVAAIWDVHKRDQKRFDFKATSTVIQNLYKTMAIKDEVWVAELLTSPEKYARDNARYRIDASRGDKVSYVHLNRPQFEVFGYKIEFDIQTKDWMLRLMRSAKVLRRLLPSWHAKEKDFQTWYWGLVQNFHYFDSMDDYNAYVMALSTPDAVKGYREIRYPLMEKAKESAAGFIEQIKTKKYQSSPRIPISG